MIRTSCRQRLALPFMLALLLSSAAGCGGKDKYIPVSGKVLIDGTTPLKKGAVQYHPDKDNKFEGLATGTIDENGEYTLSTDGKEGVPPGWYKVTVQASEPTDPKNEQSPPRFLINRRFSDVSSTTLPSIEVKADAESGAYDLKVTR